MATGAAHLVVARCPGRHVSPHQVSRMRYFGHAATAPRRRTESRLTNCGPGSWCCQQPRSGGTTLRISSQQTPLRVLTTKPTRILPADAPLGRVMHRGDPRPVFHPRLPACLPTGRFGPRTMTMYPGQLIATFSPVGSSHLHPANYLVDIGPVSLTYRRPGSI